jgi:hypothetical protein
MILTPLGHTMLGVRPNQDAHDNIKAFNSNHQCDNHITDDSAAGGW